MEENDLTGQILEFLKKNKSSDVVDIFGGSTSFPNIISKFMLKMQKLYIAYGDPIGLKKTWFGSLDVSSFLFIALLFNLLEIQNLVTRLPAFFF